MYLHIVDLGLNSLEQLQIIESFFSVMSWWVCSLVGRKGGSAHVGVWMEWFVKTWCWTTQPMKVSVKVWWGSGVLCNIQELYMVRFPGGIDKNGTSLSLHFLRGNSLRIEWTCNVFSSIFGSLGDWNVSGTWVYAHFLSCDLGCGLNFFFFWWVANLGSVV